MEIDIVVTWVDDSDLSWRQDRDGHMPDARVGSDGITDIRFRDWGTLRYFLRGIEEFCPWVRKVHLVTVNPLPEWLDQSAPKLHVVKHSDYIPAEYLPTFNSHVLEVNMHRIEGLAERWVYFNDDFFVIRPISSEHFFPNGKPAGVAVANTLSGGDLVSHAMLNNLSIINNHFDKKRVIASNLRKWLNPSYGIHNLRTLALLPWPRFTGFHQHHMPQPFLKSTFDAIWNVEEAALNLTSESKFRRPVDVSPYLFSDWQLCSGHFSPVNPRKYGKFLEIDDDSMPTIISTISSGSYPVVCINDGEVSNFEEARETLQGAFESILPTKSSYEK
jgi:hypothetical protein